MDFLTGIKHGFVKREYINGRVTVGNITAYPEDAQAKSTEEFSWTEYILVFPTREEARESHSHEVLLAADINQRKDKEVLTREP